MSSTKFNTNTKFNNSNIQKKPFCKVCQDAGKPESEYTSHYVRSRPDHNGKTTVTCPTLNNTECRYCYKLGHTTKFCPVIEENAKRAKREESRVLKVVLPKVQEKKKQNTAFDLLLDDSEDESSDERKNESRAAAHVKEDFPTLFGLKESSTSVAKPVFSYAAMAEKPAAPVVFKPTVALPALKKITNWADYSDSDSDSESEADEPVAVTTSRELVSYEDDEW